MSADWRIRLEVAKKAAQSEHDDEKAEAQISLLDHLFEVAPTGSSVFKFTLQDAAYRIQLASQGGKVPLAYCRIRSHWLTSLGVQEAVDQLRLIVSTFGELQGPINISRVDICADFMSPIDLGEIVKEHWVTRGRDIKQHWVGEACSGWSFAPSAVVSAALYDKTLELLRSHKDYLKPLWADAGWLPGQKVYRLEFRFEREALAEMGARSYPDVLGKLGALWRYSMEDWLRLVVPNPEDATKSRWAVHPLWLALSAADWADAGKGARVKARRDSAPPDTRFFAALLATLAGYMGAKGLTEPEEAIWKLYDETRAYFDDRRRFTGESFEGKAVARASRKAKEYNVSFPESTQRAADKLRQAAAAAYRKATGG